MHTRRHLTGDAPGSSLSARFAAIRAEIGVPAGFPEAVLTEAQDAARRGPRDAPPAEDAPFFTLDPPGSRDLDQAMSLSRDGSGFRVRYAIADLPAFVAPGGATDAEARSRGVTVYSPDLRTPLHPPALSEGAASLLPGVPRAAFVWDIRLDATGEIADFGLERRTVTSRARMDYASVHHEIETGTADAQLTLLREIGLLRIELESARGGASLALPDQEVVRVPSGWSVRFVPPLPAEDWNAQISLLTGIVAARIMATAGIGILRTMPPADSRALAGVRAVATALGIDWPEDRAYGEMLRTLDRADSRHLAFVHRAARLFRGAGYTVLDASTRGAQAPVHAALATPYAHVTAPLRRLVDRFGLVTCDHLHHGRPVPDWVVGALPDLPDIMAAADRRAGAVERASVDAVEAAVLSTRVGETMDASVIDANDHDILVQLTSVGVEARAAGMASPGEVVRVDVRGASISAGTVDLVVAGTAEG